MTHSAKILCFSIYADNGHEKFLICIENEKMKKIRTYSPSKLACLGKYVFGNAKFVSHGQIKNFTFKKWWFRNIEKGSQLAKHINLLRENLQVWLWFEAWNVVATWWMDNSRENPLKWSNLLNNLDICQWFSNMQISFVIWELCLQYTFVAVMA